MRKRIFIGLAVAAAAVGGVATSAQATPAAPNQCPTGWSLSYNYWGSDTDKNNDGYICYKEIPGLGGGNTGFGANFKDNKGW